MFSIKACFLVNTNKLMYVNLFVLVSFFSSALGNQKPSWQREMSGKNLSELLELLESRSSEAKSLGVAHDGRVIEREEIVLTRGSMNSTGSNKLAKSVSLLLSKLDKVAHDVFKKYEDILHLPEKSHTLRNHEMRKKIREAVKAFDTIQFSFAKLKANIGDNSQEIRKEIVDFARKFNGRYRIIKKAYQQVKKLEDLIDQCSQGSKSSCDEIRSYSK